MALNLIGDLDEAALAAIAATVRTRIMAASVGWPAPAAVTAMEIAGAAVAFIVHVATQVAGGNRP